MSFMQTTFWMRTLASSVVFAILGFGVAILGGGVGPCSGSLLSVCGLLAGLLAAAVGVLAIAVLAFSGGLRWLGRMLEARYR